MRSILKSSERRCCSTQFNIRAREGIAQALAFVEQVSRQTRHSEDGGWKRLARRREAGDSRQ